MFGLNGGRRALLGLSLLVKLAGGESGRIGAQVLYGPMEQAHRPGLTSESGNEAGGVVHVD